MTIGPLGLDSSDDLIIYFPKTLATSELFARRELPYFTVSLAKVVKDENSESSFAESWPPKMTARHLCLRGLSFLSELEAVPWDMGTYA